MMRSSLVSRLSLVLPTGLSCSLNSGSKQEALHMDDKFWYKVEIVPKQEQLHHIKEPKRIYSGS